MHFNEPPGGPLPDLALPDAAGTAIHLVTGLDAVADTGADAQGVLAFVRRNGLHQSHSASNPTQGWIGREAGAAA